jgi:hypothetical protein
MYAKKKFEDAKRGNQNGQTKVGSKLDLGEVYTIMW